MKPRVTVVIPTRERSDTLLWALKTCVTQDYDELEILVSDNASTDDTRDVVESYDDGRIRYINPGRRLGMSEHWEFAFGHLTPGYVCVIGDDDGLLPDAVADVSQIVEGSDLPLVWAFQQYFWPTYPDPALANSLIMPLRQPPTVREVDSRSSVRAVLADNSRYPLLPSPYFGIVPTSAIDEIRGRCGSVFCSITPDIYAGFAVAAVRSTYLQTDRAYSLAGQSGHSNGASQLSGRGSQDDNSPAAKFDRENTIPFHPDLTVAPSIPIAVTEAAMQARDHLALDVTLDIRALISAALRDPMYVLNPAVRPAIDRALAKTADSHGLGDHFVREMRNARLFAGPRFVNQAFRSLAGRQALIPCDPALVRDVFGAAHLVANSRARFEPPVIGRARRATARFSKIMRGLRAGRTRLRTG